MFGNQMSSAKMKRYTTLFITVFDTQFSHLSSIIIFEARTRVVLTGQIHFGVCGGSIPDRSRAQGKALVRGLREQSLHEAGLLEIILQ